MERDNLKECAMGLIKQKDEMENNIKKLLEDMEMYIQKGYDKKLTDSEGFPRQDIDFGELQVYRQLRQQYNMLNNDHNQLMKQIEQKLFQINEMNIKNKGQYDQNSSCKVEQYREMEVEQQPEQKIRQEESIEDQKKKCFARITEVSAESPSDQCGIKVGDLIYCFGKANFYNHDELGYLREQVMENQNRNIVVQLIRNDRLIGVVLKPRIWKGQGLLGCRFSVVK